MSLPHRKQPAEFSARAGLGWLLTVLYLLGGLLSLAEAVEEWTAYHAVAYLELAPDGREQRTRPLVGGAWLRRPTSTTGVLRGRSGSRSGGG